MDHMLEAALKRVLRHARRLAYIGQDEEQQRNGLYATMQQVAIGLDGLEAAVRDYDEICRILSEESSTQQETAE